MSKEKLIVSTKEMMEDLLGFMGLQALVEVSHNEKGLFINLKGDREGILIGKHGKTLESLEFLFNRMVNKRLNETVKVYVDVNGYKARRIDSLTKMAIRLGERVKRGARPLTIGPYNPHDRRIIHMALKNDPLLETESIGDGEMKRIRILLKSEKAGSDQP